jgi:hypothetical protein
MLGGGKKIIRAGIYIYTVGRSKVYDEVSKKARGRMVGMDLTVKRAAWRGTG